MTFILTFLTLILHTALIAMQTVVCERENFSGVAIGEIKSSDDVTFDQTNNLLHYLSCAPMGIGNPRYDAQHIGIWNTPYAIVLRQKGLSIEGFSEKRLLGTTEDMIRDMDEIVSTLPLLSEEIASLYKVARLDEEGAREKLHDQVLRPLIRGMIEKDYNPCPDFIAPHKVEEYRSQRPSTPETPEMIFFDALRSLARTPELVNLS